MADRDEKNNSNKKPYGDSVELFEGMFQNELEQMKESDGREDEGTATDTPPPDHKEAVEAKKISEDISPAEKPAGLDKEPVVETEKEPKKPFEEPPIHEKVITPDRKDISADIKAGKGSNTLKIALSVVFLVALTVVVINYHGIIDFGKLIGISGPIDKVITKKDVVNGLPGEAIKKEVAIVSVQPEVHGDEAEPGEADQAGRAVSPPQTTETVAEKEGPDDEQPVSVVQPREEEIPDKIEASPGERLSYPYSVLLGAFGTIERTKRAVSTYRKDGLSPYYVKGDLGEKGIWFRIFTGHFERKEQAEELISKKRLKDAGAKNTRYAALIGSYSTKEELDEKRLMLSDLGYSPYVIDGVNGWSHLFIGAFYTKIGAELRQQDLAAKGIRSRVVER